MTLTLDLTPEQEERLRAQADALALTPDRYLKKLAGLDDTQPVPGLDSDIPDVIPPGQSLADALAGRVGTQSSGGRCKYSAKDSGKAFTEMMAEKHKQGRL